MIDVHLAYVSVAYAILACFVGVWLSLRVNQAFAKTFTKTLSANHFLFKINRWWVCVPILVVLGSCFESIYGIFGVPSVLTLALAMSYLIQKLTGKAVLVNQKTQAWFGAVAVLIFLMALGVFNAIGVDVYHHFDGVSLVVQYAIIAMIFVVAYLLDGKSSWLAWAVLWMMLCHPMQSLGVLDYVADIWLFVWGAGFAIKQIINKMLVLTKPTRKGV